MTPSLEHRNAVTAVAFNLDGTRLVTASLDKTVRIWAIAPDTRPIGDWRILARCSPFTLVHGVLTRNPDPMVLCPRR